VPLLIKLRLKAVTASDYQRKLGPYIPLLFFYKLL